MSLHLIISPPRHGGGGGVSRALLGSLVFFLILQNNTTNGTVSISTPLCADCIFYSLTANIFPINTSLYLDSIPLLEQSVALVCYRDENRTTLK